MVLAVFSLSPTALLKSQSSMKKSNTSQEIQESVSELMAKMSLADKVGEMTQLAIDQISYGEPYNLDEPHTLHPERLKHVLVDLRVGSILNVGGHAYSREHWEEIITTIQDLAINQKASGIPVLYGIDAIHGTNFTLEATLFPQQISLANSWNRGLAKTTGKITAYETRASGIPWTFSPVQDLGRDPRWPRIWETFGEDVYLASEMGVAMVQGYEGDDISAPDQVASCMKHFLGYSMPWSGKDRTPVHTSERHLREIFAKPFQATVNANSKTVMICSGEVNGIPVHCNPKILKDLLREEMGFKGVAVTDWEDIGYLYTRHKVAKDFKEAIKLSINAGIDLAMVPNDTQFPILLKELVEAGEVPMERIEESVRRILTLKFELGLFDQAYYPFEDYDKFGCEAHTQAAFEAAIESLVLVKNEDKRLPLAKDLKVLVTGPTANSLNALNGGWTGTWQGDDPKYNTTGKQTILDAIQNKIGADNVQYFEGTSFDKAINIQAAVEAANQVDAVIVCIGEMTYTEKPGDMDDLNLPEAQLRLVKALSKANKPIIMVQVGGRPRIIREAVGHADAIITAFLPGNEGGRALAEVIFGDANPSGKLAITYPQFANDLLTYDHKGTEQFSRNYDFEAFQPQFEFGHGLSYTQFEYSDLKLSSTKLSDGAPLNISVTVKNTGDRTGKEVVQLYITDKVASVTPPVKRLRGFEKIELAAGESKTVQFEIEVDDLAFVGIENTWITEPGEFEVQLGGFSAIFEY